MTLELLVCTIDNGIHNIKNLILAPIEGVSYLISWQHSEHFTPYEIPNELKRNDIKIITLQGRGLSRNRNNALRNASGDICLIADDDCTYRPEYFNDILHTFQDNPAIDVATFKIKHCSEGKTYSSHSFNLKKFDKGYYVSSIEIAFRRNSVQGKFWFNELFGLGAPVLQSGEDNIFILDAVKSGLNCRFFPIIIVEHNHPTTASTRTSNPGVIMAEGAYISIAYPITATIRLILKAHRLNKANRLGFFLNLRHLIAGISYYHKQKK
ncbi:MAG: glycosyltransferase family 2 protein [Bacteroidales bacterium]|nr:glycosyltransferase family 2 protein [Bacteroidales bacterium]